MFEESYQITSEFLELQVKSENVCRIVSNHIRFFYNFKTSPKSFNMFVESYQITSEFFRTLKQILKMFVESYQITSDFFRNLKQV